MNHLTRMLLGGFAGLLGWAIIEPTNPGIQSLPAWGAFEMRLILIWGLLIGFAIGGYNGYLQGSRAHVLRGMLLGGLLGAIGASLGYSLGGRIQASLFGPMNQVSAAGNLVRLVLGRIVGLAPLGICLGAAIGASTADWRRAWHGAIGGALGAGAGAIIFDLVGSVIAGAALTLQGIPGGQVGEIGQIPRAVFALALGSMIALFIGLVEQMARQAWVRQALGRNEGREWAIYAPRTAIGRSELVQVPIFGDMGIAPVHAYIDRRGGEYWLLDAGSGPPTFLNGQRVQAAPLFPGAQIQVGHAVLQFLLRGFPGSVPAGISYQAPGQGGGAHVPPFPHPQVPMPSSPVPAGYAPTQGPTTPTTVMPAQAPAGPSLLALDGPFAGQRFPISTTLEIGRESAGLRMAMDSNVSRRHASISVAPSGLILNDLGSTNGTFVNGTRVTTAVLRNGDVLKIGGTCFRVEA